jgi:hypothetical protein
MSKYYKNHQTSKIIIKISKTIIKEVVEESFTQTKAST